ncbi:hypothetical protein B4U80_09271 [Leptotrombidium deliense]|uniref:Uncharacterized protein n=1 Tax=Leptotrombidium deliense TaxID=299467 RepID=A0A443S7U5_9ACAR|nr:hypothetical protein B4U80_09271 [Leptotrombidium deliense]
MIVMTTSEILQNIYYDPKNPASFSTVDKLYTAAKSKSSDIKRKDVRQWLSDQLTYTLHKPRRHNFKRNRIIVSRINEQWEADLVDMQEFQRQNKSYKYLITVIDVFSKKAHVLPIKSKSANDMVNAMHSLFKSVVPESLRTDKGLEFTNKKMSDLFNAYGINFFTSNNKHIKCAVVERFNRTLKAKMFKYFTANGTRKYIEVLDDFTNSYNNTVHRSIGMRPNEVREGDEKQIFQKLYGKSIKPHESNLQIGDKVRVVYEKKPFDKSYYPNWTDHIYTVNKISKKQKPLYTLEGYDGKNEVQRYYPEEVQKIGHETYRIEKIIKRRVRNKTTEYLIKWLNFPTSQNSWINAEDVFNIGRSKES